MAKVVIFGVGQIAEIAHFYLTHDSEHEVVAFVVDRAYLQDSSFHGLPVVAFEDVVVAYPPAHYKMLLPISYKKLNKIRAEKYAEAKKLGYSFISYISSKAIYYDTPVGENCFILENNIIQPFSVIGHNCILWSGNHIGHHVVIQDHCFLASQVVVSGKVTIGTHTFIGVNATIADNVIVGKENIIGAGALILKNTEDQAIFSVTQTEKSPIPSHRLRGF